MKRIVVFSLFLIFTISISAQPIIDFGFKSGINNSKITANINEFTAESIVKAHIGVFARFGYSRVYVQPEAYFSSKGGELYSENTSILQTATKFDFNNIDVPVLLGVKVIKGELGNVRVMAGPVFSFMMANDVFGDAQFTKQYFEDNYFGFQYGVGVDIWTFFLDARIEHGSNDLYVHPNLTSKNRTFMVTLGFKIL